MCVKQGSSEGVRSAPRMLPLPAALPALPFPLLPPLHSSPQRCLQSLPPDQLLGSDVQQLDCGPSLAQLEKHGLAR